MKSSIDLARARSQHKNYCHVLSELGLDVIHLDMDSNHPDSCFVEDTAVVENGRALICRLAKESRMGEEDAVETALSDYMPVRRAIHPATIEGGDVLHLPDRLVCGMTQRTNRDGIAQMARWIDVKVDVFHDPRIMHLKSYVTYLGKGKVLATKEYASHPTLKDLEVLIVPDDERQAANTLTIGDNVIMFEGNAKTIDSVKKAGFDVIPVNIGEIPKCEGALTCLSVLF